MNLQREIMMPTVIVRKAHMNFCINTFGEFRTANFILRNTINEVKDIL